MSTFIFMWNVFVCFVGYTYIMRGFIAVFTTHSLNHTKETVEKYVEKPDKCASFTWLISLFIVFPQSLRIH